MDSAESFQSKPYSHASRTVPGRSGHRICQTCFNLYYSRPQRMMARGSQYIGKSMLTEKPATRSRVITSNVITKIDTYVGAAPVP